MPDPKPTQEPDDKVKDALKKAEAEVARLKALAEGAKGQDAKKDEMPAPPAGSGTERVTRAGSANADDSKPKWPPTFLRNPNGYAVPGNVSTAGVRPVQGLTNMSYEVGKIKIGGERGSNVLPAAIHGGVEVFLDKDGLETKPRTLTVIIPTTSVDASFKFYVNEPQYYGKNGENGEAFYRTSSGRMLKADAELENPRNPDSEKVVDKLYSVTLIPPPEANGEKGEFIIRFKDPEAPIVQRPEPRVTKGAAKGAAKSTKSAPAPSKNEQVPPAPVDAMEARKEAMQKVYDDIQAIADKRGERASDPVRKELNALAKKAETMKDKPNNATSKQEFETALKDLKTAITNVKKTANSEGDISKRNDALALENQILGIERSYKKNIGTQAMLTPPPGIPQDVLNAIVIAPSIAGLEARPYDLTMPKEKVPESMKDLAALAAKSDGGRYT